MFQNTSEKGEKHDDPDDPPRCRANNRPGAGTMDRVRPMHIADTGRSHVTVCHSRHEYARDDDGDGFCEVHCNTMEGIWTGLRNFLRPFRGAHKKYLAALRGGRGIGAGTPGDLEGQPDPLGRVVASRR